MKAGVWIDHEQAIVILITDAGPKIKKFVSEFDKPTGAPHSNAHMSKDYVTEDRLENKVQGQLKTYHDDIIACLEGCEALLILGPGEAKGEFLKRLESKKLRGVTIALETADKLSEGQLKAKVVEHFGEAP
jgi:hypothetical protein